jgi:glycosyltransferase involved in cell wall biosynthesis
MTEIFRQHAGLGDDLSAAARVVRLHWYYLARSLARGLDVLDLAPGDGAGLAVVGQTARSVSAGGDEPADLVIGFGLLERAADPAALTARVRGLVRQGGVVLLDVAANPGPEARHGFAVEEVRALLLAKFAAVGVLSQFGMVGSAALGAGGVPLVFRHRDLVRVEAGRGVARPDRYLFVAATAGLPELSDTLFAEAGLDDLSEAQSRARVAEDGWRLLREDHAALEALASARQAAEARWRLECATLRVSVAAAEGRARELAAARDRAVAALVARPEPAPAQGGARPVAVALPALRRREGSVARSVARRVRVALQGALGGVGGLRDRVSTVRASTLFDAGWYAVTYPDVGAAGLDAARHYVTHGAAEGRNPGPAFDAAYYVAQHPDSLGAGTTPLEHYERHGRAAGWTVAPAPAGPNPDVLFIAGEPDTPGSTYRCIRYAEAARAAGWRAGWMRLEQVTATDLIGVRVGVLWRVRWSDHVRNIVHELRQGGGLVVCDLDDLMLRPELATPRVIDGIRTTQAGLASTRETFAQVRQAMLEADLCSATTDELAGHMRDWQKAAFVLPNGYDAAWLARSREAVRRRAAAPGDGMVRIGYAAGTLTHQRDFAVALPGLVRVLAARPTVRLVLFRTAEGLELVTAEEFDPLVPYADRIEWRATVAHASLPDELARFDINIAPLEVGNPFCEAKSELKFFEAALVSVPTVASPTGPFRRCMTDGRNGFLAGDDEAWQNSLLRLVDDAGLRAAMGKAAAVDCLWRFGPRRRAAMTDLFLRQAIGGGDGARAFALQAQLRRAEERRGVTLAPAEELFRHDTLAEAAVTVVVPCYNYADFVLEALESVRAQTLGPLHLVVVDDASTDAMATTVVLEWLRTHEARFGRAVLQRHRENAGLAAARNSGFAAAETEFVLPLDADNRLLPACCTRLLAAMEAADAPGFAYGSLRMFGAADGIFSNEAYRPVRLTGGNYIDAMALIARWAWAAAGGYDMPRGMGWEDFDFWCRLAELGLHGIHVDHVVAEYRVHGGSMLDTAVEVESAKQAMVALMERRHDWLRLSSRTPRERISS